MNIMRSSTPIGDRLSGLQQALKKAFTPEPKYPHVPGNLEPETHPDLIVVLKSLGFKDYETLLAFLNASVQGTIDDNDLLLERLIQLLSKLPSASKERKQLTDGLLTNLWNSLDHPPHISLGRQFKYRSADGSGNNINHPELGAANQPYVRTVAPMTLQTPNQPDPATIFDLLMSRGDKFEPHPQGISSMLFYLATLIIHDIFQTDSSDYNNNLTSSYLDLSPLYGRNEKEQVAMRTFKNGYLKSDSFSSKRLMGFPPGCGVFLVMFNRFHNYVVTQLAQINENGRFTKPDPAKLASDKLKAAWKKYDEDLFQTGRLITCGLYANIILTDYVKTILALNRADTTWNLDPRSRAGKNIFSQPSPEGVGNQVSVEFNLIYRWHSTVSQRDEKWTIDEFKRILEGKDPKKATLAEVLQALAKFDRNIPDEPEKRKGFGDLARNDDGTYDDDELVKTLTESIEDIAGSFGANKVPDILKPVESLGIMQSRYWNVATLNEFRSFMGLTKHTTFEDINPDPVVAQRLKSLYDSPDSVELYPGLVAEKPKPPMSPGSGLCVNYTTSKAILSDAVSLIRGDRFHTLDYTPRNITNWGFNEAHSDPTLNQGHVMHKLIFRAFPHHFVHNSIYAIYPFVIPAENKKIHETLGSASKYSWETPRRRPFSPAVIRSHAAVTTVLKNSQDIPPTWHQSASGLAKTLSPNQPNWAKEIPLFIKTKTTSLLKRHSIPVLSSTGKLEQEVDIIRDVVALTTTHLFSALFVLPLKTPSNPHGIYSEMELFDILTTIYTCFAGDGDIAYSFQLQSSAQKMAKELGEAVICQYKSSASGSVLKKVEGVLHGHDHADSDSGLPEWGNSFLHKIVEAEGGNIDNPAVWGKILTMVSKGVAVTTQLVAECLAYYTGEEGKEHVSKMYWMANTEGERAEEVLVRYFLEGCRISGGVVLAREMEGDLTVAESVENSLSLRKGQKVLVDFTTASRDAKVFQDPEKVKLDRPMEAYLPMFGDELEKYLGDLNNAASKGMVVPLAIFKAVVGHSGLRAVDGARGRLKGFPVTGWDGQIRQKKEEEWSGVRKYMTADERGFVGLPVSLRVRYST
ncbi:putative linoleate diol synthase [Podospora australis]|uniref:Linoleate diol synthase n=1 Tax=Podospora australis TaxID=1536484 RepID=A0AAN6WTF8_9PEZI|nr:putative linoleate diol synthase [Podospora australis]